jgi:hypothetical protein
MMLLDKQKRKMSGYGALKYQKRRKVCNKHGTIALARSVAQAM